MVLESQFICLDRCSMTLSVFTLLLFSVSLSAGLLLNSNSCKPRVVLVWLLNILKCLYVTLGTKFRTVWVLQGQPAMEWNIHDVHLVQAPIARRSIMNFSFLIYYTCVWPHKESVIWNLSLQQRKVREREQTELIKMQCNVFLKGWFTHITNHILSLFPLVVFNI